MPLVHVHFILQVREETYGVNFSNKIDQNVTSPTCSVPIYLDHEHCHDQLLQTRLLPGWWNSRKGKSMFWLIVGLPRIRQQQNLAIHLKLLLEGCM